MPLMDYDSFLRTLRNAGASTRCKELVQILKDLGFNVRDGKRGGHKIITHEHLAGFTTASFNCGHGKNSQVKRPYLQDMIKLLENYETELRDYLDRVKT